MIGDSVMVIMWDCRSRDPGSIPGLRVSFSFFPSSSIYPPLCHLSPPFILLPGHMSLRFIPKTPCFPPSTSLGREWSQCNRAVCSNPNHSFLSIHCPFSTVKRWLECSARLNVHIREHLELCLLSLCSSFSWRLMGDYTSFSTNHP